MREGSVETVKKGQRCVFLQIERSRSLLQSMQQTNRMLPIQMPRNWITKQKTSNVSFPAWFPIKSLCIRCHRWSRIQNGITESSAREEDDTSRPGQGQPFFGSVAP